MNASKRSLNMIEPIVEQGFADETAEIEQPLSETDIAELAQSISETSATLYGTSVFDHTAMSRLSPASAVSFWSSNNRS